MARPSKPSPSENPPASPVNDWIVRLIDNGIFSQELFDLATKCAKQNLSNRPTRKSPSDDYSQRLLEEARDLAGDFLIFHIKANNLRLIFTRTELQKEFSRYLTRRNNPEYHELWALLSDAIRELAVNGRAIRLDASFTDNNCNTALWASTGTNQTALFDPTNFRRRAKQIGNYYPRREEGRIIPPSKALELTEKILFLAQAPIPFAELVNEARNHVVLSMQFEAAIAEEGENEEEEKKDRHYLTAEHDNEIMLWISEEAPPRATAIWQKVTLQNNGRILCLYVLPKHFLGQRTTLSQFGSPQRVGEQSMEVMYILAESLKLDRLGSDGRKEQDLCSRALLYLASRVAELLSEKCSENDWPVSLSIAKETQGGKMESKQ